MAIMHALDEWCHFLKGAAEKFMILMDHRNLAYFWDAVGRITTHILKSSNFANLYLKNMNKTGMSGLTSEGRGFTPNSNKANYSGHLCEDNAIYLKTIRSELMEIQLDCGHFGDKINRGLTVG